MNFTVNVAFWLFVLWVILGEPIEDVIRVIRAIRGADREQTSNGSDDSKTDR